MAHVIIADDDYGILYLVAMLVRRLGWTSDLVSDGVQAWQKVQGQAAFEYRSSQSPTAKSATPKAN